MPQLCLFPIHQNDYAISFLFSKVFFADAAFAPAHAKAAFILYHIP